MADLAKITVYELTCDADDYTTEDGSGFPETVEPYEVELITIDSDDVAGYDSLDDAIQTKLDEFSCGQWDGGNTGYDPDGAQMNSQGEMTERWARVVRL
jgi:hypothetical protein